MLDRASLDEAGHDGIDLTSCSLEGARNGAGAGYGVLASGGELKTGKMSAADNFAAPSPVQDEGLWLNSNGLLMRFKGTKVRVQDDELKINGVPKIKLNDPTPISRCRNRTTRTAPRNRRRPGSTCRRRSRSRRRCR